MSSGYTDKILDAPYDPKPPDRTVGAKRKIDETIPLGRAEAALRTAEQQVRRTRQELDKLGSAARRGFAGGYGRRSRRGRCLA